MKKGMKKVKEKDEIIRKLIEHISPEELSEINIPQKELEKYTI